MSTKKRSYRSNQLRIIGGMWRRRIFTFPSIDGLRPTPDRMRETLFNWLMLKIENATCLDLFAGSGALGFEALSRGAASVTMIETSREAYKSLLDNKEKFNIETSLDIICTTAENFLKNTNHSFDIIFVDPPFHHQLIEPTCNLIEKHKALKPGGYVYIEKEQDLPPLKLPIVWNLIKEKHSGQVEYLLLCNSSNH